MLNNLKTIIEKLKENVNRSTTDLTKAKNDYREVQLQFDDMLVTEKEHFKRVKEFEDACIENDELIQKLADKNGAN